MLNRRAFYEQTVNWMFLFFAVLLGRRQVASHGTLTPAFAGSNPAAPIEALASRVVL